ncbi:MAG: carbohydrate-binding family 9-like protein [Acidobacteriaceae bacterium]
MANGLPPALSSQATLDVEPDTNPNSAFWQSAPHLIFEGGIYGNKIPGHSTEVRSRWTENNLYFLFRCPYQELHLKPDPDTSAKTSGLWNWDVAEAFIGSTGDPMHRYKEFELSPQTEWLDLDINLENADKVNDHFWSSGFQVAAHIATKEKTWYGCMRIPYAAIENSKAVAGNTLRINFFRSQGPKPLELAWRPPMQESFHAPEQFGLLRLIR